MHRDCGEGQQRTLAQRSMESQRRNSWKYSKWGQGGMKTLEKCRRRKFWSPRWPWPGIMVGAPHPRRTPLSNILEKLLHKTTTVFLWTYKQPGRRHRTLYHAITAFNTAAQLAPTARRRQRSRIPARLYQLAQLQRRSRVPALLRRCLTAVWRTALFHLGQLTLRSR